MTGQRCRTVAAVDDPPTASRLHRFRRVAGQILALPAWLLCVTIGLTYAALWLVPTSLEPATPGGRAWLTIVFGLSVVQFHAGLVAAVVPLIALVLRRRRLLVVSGLVAAALLGAEAWRIVPDVMRPTGTGPTFRVASMNLYFWNRNLDAIEAEARRIDADVLVVQEYMPFVHGRLFERLADLYPYSERVETIDTAGRVVLAKRPIDGGDRSFHRDGRRRVTVDFDGTPLQIVSVHHRSPGGVDTVTRNAQQMAALLQTMPRDRDGGPIVYLGDFNAGHWTPQLRALRQRGLTDAFDASTWGRGGTWPTQQGRPPRAWVDGVPRSLVVPAGLAVRIDHILTSDDLVAIRSGVGHLNGSDHRPVWADLRRVAD